MNQEKMLGKFFICEAPRLEKYVKAINTIREYKDGRSFPINEVVTADKPINILATKKRGYGRIKCYKLSKCIKMDFKRGYSL